MIKANELRMGNFFYDADGNIKKIDYTDFVSLSITVKHYTPIPLTPEILARCEFESNGNVYSKGGFLLINKPEGFLFAIIDQIVSYRLFQYLHQLQNLYSGLNNGEELEIKEIRQFLPWQF